MDAIIVNHMGVGFQSTNCILGMLNEVADTAIRKHLFMPPKEESEPIRFQPLQTVGTPLYVEDLLEAIMLATNQSGYVSVMVVNTCLRKLLPGN